MVLTQTGPTAAPRIDDIAAQPNGEVQLLGTGQPGALYHVERSADLVGWTLRGTVAADAVGLIQYTDPDGAALPCAYYRLATVDTIYTD